MATSLPRAPTKLFPISYGRTKGYRIKDSNAVVTQQKLSEKYDGKLLYGVIEYLTKPCLVMRFGFLRDTQIFKI